MKTRYLFQFSIYFVGLFLTTCFVNAQDAAYYRNPNFLKVLNRDTSYTNLKKKVVNEFLHASPGAWGEFIKGVDEDFYTKHKYIAFTFDACGGLHRNGYNAKLIEYLRKERIPATFFITGLWIDANFKTFMELSKDTLFEIENHGFNHRPCSIDGESKYGVQGTKDASQAFDELEANERKIEALTHRRPIFYRSATAFMDESGVKMAHQLRIQPISFQVLSGDAVPFTAPSVIEDCVLKNVKPGVIVIMHINHPEWYTYEAMERIVPKLRKEGYEFVHLKNLHLYNGILNKK